MSKPNLSFFFDGAEITVDEMGAYVASNVFGNFSEYEMELLAKDISHAILGCVSRKVHMAKQVSDRRDWVSRHPPNHAGFYYCHLCAGWVHESQAELDHVTPKSVRRGEDPNRDDNRRMAHAWPIVAPSGKLICPGNRGKGSRSLPSMTMEIAPPDWEL